MADWIGYPVVKLQSPTIQPPQEATMDNIALLQWFNPTLSKTNLCCIGRIVFALTDRVSMLSISSSAARFSGNEPFQWRS